MSWLPSGLTSFTDQISNFTKDVLAEGTEEIHDHVTELRVCKSRCAELESVCAAQRSELDRFKIYTDELNVKIQSQEMQIRTNSDQYRAAMEIKEKEMKVLKQSHADLLDDHSTHASDSSSILSFISSDHHGSTSTANGGRSHTNFHGGEEEDFDDVISSQHTINRLGAEVKRLEAEVRRLRHTSAAQTNAAVDVVNIDGEQVNVSQLQAEIKELKQHLSDSIETHQHTLSSLEDKHRQTIAAVRRAQQEKIDQMSANHESVTADGSIAELKMRVEELENRNRKLEFDLEHMHAADRRKAMVVDELTEELSTAKHSSTSLSDRLLKENEILQRDLIDYKQRWQEFEQADARPVAGGDVKDSSSYEELTQHAQQLESQVFELTGKIESYEQELEQFDLVKSDWQTEKESLEKTLIRLREQLNKKEEELCIAQARKDVVRKRAKGKHSATADLARFEDGEGASEGLMETTRGRVKAQRRLLAASAADASMVTDDQLQREMDDEDEDEDEVDEDDDVEAHAHRLNKQVQQLTDESAQLEAERDQLLVDKADITAQMNSKDLQIAELNAKLMSEISNKNMEGAANNINQSYLDDIVQQLAEKHKELERVTADKDSLEGSLEELDAQHNTALAQIVTSRNELSKTVDALRVRVKELELKLTQSEKKTADVPDDFAEQLRLASEKEINLLSLISGIKSELDIAKRHNVELENKMVSAVRQSEERLKEVTTKKKKVPTATLR